MQEASADPEVEMKYMITEYKQKMGLKQCPRIYGEPVVPAL